MIAMPTLKAKKVWNINFKRGRKQEMLMSKRRKFQEEEGEYLPGLKKRGGGGIQDVNLGTETKSLSSITPKTSLRCWSHTGVILTASSQNNNCHHIRCRKKFEDSQISL
jgi:hypothetical protein